MSLFIPIELEQALRLRDEEIRNLKEDKSDLTLKNIELRNELDAADGMLEELQTNFQQTKSELHETFIELKSTEAVVEAQVETETSLTLQGVDMLRDLSARQNDVDNLLSKVDRMVVKESERMNLTAQFVSTVTVNSAELGSAAAILSQQSNDHSKKLSAGVEHVIMSGAEICGELQAAIDAAVGELKVIVFSSL
jgi:ribosome-associated translation inhibitor RaiA